MKDVILDYVRNEYLDEDDEEDLELDENTPLISSGIVDSFSMVSLKRFLLEQRVPADLRDELPLVAVGPRVLWVPGQPAEPPRPPRGERLVQLELQPAPRDPARRAAATTGGEG